MRNPLLCPPPATPDARDVLDGARAPLEGIEATLTAAEDGTHDEAT
jgi:hypothetical protein